MEDLDAPATKRDLIDLEARVDTRLNNMESRLEGKQDAAEQRLMDFMQAMIREAETRLLQAFYSFAESDQKRHSEIERETAGIKERLATIENRLIEVERRLNFPHHPPS